jgi:hypothetical protein
VQILRFSARLEDSSDILPCLNFAPRHLSLTLPNGQGHIVSPLQFNGFGQLSFFQFCSLHQSLLCISSAIKVWKKQKSHYDGFNVLQRTSMSSRLSQPSSTRTTLRKSCLWEHPTSAPHCRSLSDYDYTSIVVVGGPQG